MKRAFVITADCHLASSLVRIGTPDVLNLGDRITVSRPLDLGHGAQIETGERGTIDHIDASTGSVEVLMDTHHRGLDAWDNHMWLEPFGTEDIIGGVKYSGAKGRSFDSVPKWARLVGVAVAASLAVTAMHMFLPDPYYTFGRMVVILSAVTLPLTAHYT